MPLRTLKQLDETEGTVRLHLGMSLLPTVLGIALADKGAQETAIIATGLERTI